MVVVGATAETLSGSGPRRRDSADLCSRIGSARFGEMKIKALGSVLVEALRRAARPTASFRANPRSATLTHARRSKRYQADKREYKATHRPSPPEPIPSTPWSARSPPWLGCALVLSGASAQALRMPAAPSARSSRPRTRGTSASTRPRWRRTRTRSRARSAWATTSTPTSARGSERRPDRDPDHRRRPQDAAFARQLRIRVRVGQGPVPDPARREDRGRAERRRRPPRARRRQGPLQASTSSSPLSAGRRRLARRLGRDLDPAQEPAAAGRLDVGRRGRPARSSRVSPATTRSTADGSTTRCASPSSVRRARTFTRPATSRATSPTPRLPPMGLRLRLKAGFDTPALSPPGADRAGAALQALRDYRRRQRLRLAPSGAPDSPLVERSAAHAAACAGLGLRGRGHQLASAAAVGRVTPRPFAPRPPRGRLRERPNARSRQRGSRPAPARRAPESPPLAVTVAVRGTSRSNAISPKKSALRAQRCAFRARRCREPHCRYDVEAVTCLPRPEPRSSPAGTATRTRLAATRSLVAIESGANIGTFLISSSSAAGATARGPISHEPAVRRAESAAAGSPPTARKAARAPTTSTTDRRGDRAQRDGPHGEAPRGRRARVSGRRRGTSLLQQGERRRRPPRCSQRRRPRAGRSQR